MSDQLINQFAIKEHAVSTEDLSQKTPQEAQVLFYGRIDSAISSAEAHSHQQVACKAGCSYCCHLKIEAFANEVLLIRQHVLTHFTPELTRLVMQQAQQNVQLAKKMDRVTRLHTNMKCAFLQDNQCSIYPVRPTNCRTHHALDANVCKSSFEQPGAALTSPQVTLILAAGTGLHYGHVQAEKAKGMDTTSYDLSAAFLEAMRKPDAIQRLKAGKRVFSTGAQANQGD